MIDDLNEEIKSAQQGLAAQAREIAKKLQKNQKEEKKKKLLVEQRLTDEQEPDKETLPEPEEEQEQREEILPEPKEEPEQEQEKEKQPEIKPEQQTRNALLPKKIIKKQIIEGDILDKIKSYESKKENDFLHVRVDTKTHNLVNKLSHVTKISNTKIVGYALVDFFKKNPELEEIIKKYLKSSDL